MDVASRMTSFNQPVHYFCCTLTLLLAAKKFMTKTPLSKKIISTRLTTRTIKHLPPSSYFLFSLLQNVQNLIMIVVDAAAAVHCCYPLLLWTLNSIIHSPFQTFFNSYLIHQSHVLLFFHDSEKNWGSQGKVPKVRPLWRL